MFVHDLVVDRYTLIGGEIWSYTRGLAVEMERAAKALAPVRTGRLRSSISASHTGSNQHGSNFRVNAGAGHAGFVVRGTSGKTVPEDHPGMRLYGSFPGGWLNTPYAPYQGARVRSVRGQWPNPFMQKAMRAVLIRHGLI
jgi:hypothetical protein